MKTPKQEFDYLRLAIGSFKNVNENAEDYAISLVTDQAASYLDSVKNGRNTALILACMRRMSRLALALIATGKTNPKQTNITGNTALHYACKNNMSEVALAIIQTGKLNPSQINIDGYTALFYACENNMSDVALELIEIHRLEPIIENKTPTVGLQYGYGYTALSMACSNKMSEVALALIATGYSRPDLKSFSNETALIYACQNKMSNVALKLIETGQSIPETVYNGYTALIWACINKMEKVALALIATGNARPELVRTRPVLFRDPSETEFLQYIENKYNMTSLIIASDKANTGLTDIDFNEIYDYLSAETQNAGKGTTTKGTTNKGTTRKGLSKNRVNKGKTRRSKQNYYNKTKKYQ